MPGYNEIMEQHEKQGKKALQLIVQDEMNKMDSKLDELASENPVIKAVWEYMEKEGLKFLMEGGKFDTQWVAKKLELPVDKVREALQIYSQNFKLVFQRTQQLHSGRVPWQNFGKGRRKA